MHGIMHGIVERGESLTSQVLRSLRQAIAVGELAPGSLHSVAKLADRLRVSRSPVREALVLLANQGMVAFERNRGVRILETTAHDVEEITTLRLLLEVPATYRAAQVIEPTGVERLREALGTPERFAGATSMAEHQELDANFHRVILDIAGNTRLVGIVDNLWSQQKSLGVTTAGHSRDLGDIHREHEKVFDRIAARDPAGAAAAMRAHLSLSARLLLAQQFGEAVDAATSVLPWLDVYPPVEPALRGPAT